jgi:hypothetical protein
MECVACGAAIQEDLKKVLQEAGSPPYAQARQTEAQITAGSAAGEARASGPDPHGRVVDAEYHDTTPRYLAHGMMRMAIRDYYDILGVPRDADDKAIVMVPLGTQPDTV